MRRWLTTDGHARELLLELCDAPPRIDNEDIMAMKMLTELAPRTVLNSTILVFWLSANKKRIADNMDLLKLNRSVDAS